LSSPHRVCDFTGQITSGQPVQHTRHWQMASELIRLHLCSPASGWGPLLFRAIATHSGLEIWSYKYPYMHIYYEVHLPVQLPISSYNYLYECRYIQGCLSASLARRALAAQDSTPKRCEKAIESSIITDAIQWRGCCSVRSTKCNKDHKTLLLDTL
jgi:hypothetical protein